MKSILLAGCILLLAVCVDIGQPLCVLESDFGFKINCAFKKSGLFRVRNLGGIKAHASLGFSLGDELGFEQSLTNLDPSRRRSVNVKNGAPPNLVDPTRTTTKQEKRGKQNRIMMRPVMPPASRPSQAAMDKLTTLHRRVSTMQPIIVSPTVEAPVRTPTITLAKPMPMGVPPFKPLPPKEDTLKVLPLTSSTRKHYTPLQVPESKGPGVAYQNQVPHQVHNIANNYNTKKVDDYNSITGYGDDTTLKFNKEDINAKIAEIAKAGNISMEAVEAAIALRQQQLLSKYANLPAAAPQTTSTTTTTTEEPVVFEPEPEILAAAVPQKPAVPQRLPTSGKVMNAPREYYPVGYEKNFDDHFQSKVDLPDTNFHCGDQKYFPGLYGDESLGCMVFHVCALTDDGLVMKSFLCPESTLFDQTILKCNWWFYVDCKNTRKLYDTNIPVSKSYQLMKALTFFSSYKKEMQDDGHPANPEDVDGIKEAISILENQDTSKLQQTKDTLNAIQIITPQPYVDERNNHKVEYSTEPAPVYRANRNLNTTRFSSTIRNETKSNSQEANSEFRFVTVNAGFNVKKEANNTSAENTSTSSERERKHRRRMTLRFSNSTTKAPTTNKTIETTTPIVEIIKQDIQDINDLTEVKQEKLTDQLDAIKEVENPAPVRRFYRSSAERIGQEKEIAVVNNEKIQIVRPTTMSRLVGQNPTQEAAIDKLDEAVLGRRNLRFKKEAVAIVTAERAVRSKTRNET
ncbi:hypothetical protein O3G_MSEX002899 [Manduca sexta]|uniref:Chitin-binding type-2 domain-containing protein n=1 Tax=Manduca sexta TaxID=7130 RepID=A0A922CES9_MANSE|nr:hypothetical protein O3G_MSEX002899 [Manduca sexta]